LHFLESLNGDVFAESNNQLIEEKAIVSNFIANDIKGVFYLPFYNDDFHAQLIVFPVLIMLIFNSLIKAINLHIIVTTLNIKRVINSLKVIL